MLHQITGSGCRFLKGHLLPLFLSAVMVIIPILRHVYAADSGILKAQDSISKQPVVLDIVPEQSELVCVVRGVFFFHLDVRMSAASGKFGTILTRVNGNSNGFMIIDLDSLETIDDKTAERIKRVHLETEKYPKISFDLINLEGGSDSLLTSQGNRLKASGILRLHGIEREIVFHPHVFVDDDVIVFQGETVVRMTDFDIEIPRFLFFKASDEVSVRYRVVWGYTP